MVTITAQLNLTIFLQSRNWVGKEKKTLYDNIVT